jgi:tRNA pseudouridine38-40 synthase
MIISKVSIFPDIIRFAYSNPWIMARYFVRLAYNGTPYHGWQIQHNARSVQQVLNEAFSLIMRDKIRLTGCGRTDTGVHAMEYYAHYESDKEYSSHELEKLIFKINSYIDFEIAILDIFRVPEKLHARFSAARRTYEYHIARRKDPFGKGFSYYLFGKLDVEMMNAGAEYLLSVKDFTSFSKVDSDTKTNLCDLVYASWEERGDVLIFTITANRFLRNMVRAIVGTLLDLGTGKITLKELKEITESKNRSNAGESVPPWGLFLTKIEYPQL